jgi:hypothetical protein
VRVGSFHARGYDLGKIIGVRTWGAEVGSGNGYPLMDGGTVTMPDFGMWDPYEGKWAVENYGVDPDIEVENTWWQIWQMCCGCGVTLTSDPESGCFDGIRPGNQRQPGQVCEVL